MIKLTTRQESQPVTIIQVEGRLNAEAAHQLREMFSSGSGTGPTVLDISGLTSIDAAGRECLAALRRSGVQLTGGSLYINQLLQEAQS